MGKSVDLLQCPIDLLFDGHVTIVEYDGIFGLTQRTNGACLIGMVAFSQILHHLFEGNLCSFGCQFSVTAFGTDPGICGHENLQFGVRENNSADISAIHDDPLLFPHLFQRLRQIIFVRYRFTLVP